VVVRGREERVVVQVEMGLVAVQGGWVGGWEGREGWG
jgi:hypothetical protein